MHQAMINYPLFCMPFQPTFSVDMFQQQAWGLFYDLIFNPVRSTYDGFFPVFYQFVFQYKMYKSMTKLNIC
jgi:hypothetical protein